MKKRSTKEKSKRGVYSGRARTSVLCYRSITTKSPRHTSWIDKGEIRVRFCRRNVEFQYVCMCFLLTCLCFVWMTKYEVFIIDGCIVKWIDLLRFQITDFFLQFEFFCVSTIQTNSYRFVTTVWLLYSNIQASIMLNTLDFRPSLLQAP